MIYGIYEKGELIRLRATCDICGIDISDPSNGTEGEGYICYKCEDKRLWARDGYLYDMASPVWGDL